MSTRKQILGEIGQRRVASSPSYICLNCDSMYDDVKKCGCYEGIPLISAPPPAMCATEPMPPSRKERPVATGVIDYFPDAIMAVAHCSYVGNEQHNPGSPLHWDRSKSGDESDALMRHFLERGTMDTDGVRHSAKVAWRALAMLQKEIESERKEDEK